MASDRDQELGKAFHDLHVLRNEAKVRSTNAEQTKQAAYITKRKAEISSKSLNENFAQQPIYRSVGRMFVLTTTEAEVTRYADVAKTAEETSAAQDKVTKYWADKVEEAEKNLREMVAARRT